jgi:hypothetical protein
MGPSTISNEERTNPADASRRQRMDGADETAEHSMNNRLGELQDHPMRFAWLSMIASHFPRKSTILRCCLVLCPNVDERRQAGMLNQQREAMPCF